ncbi:transcriptional regulatory protein QseB [Chitinimonas prasina]|uniref:Transcriptional regulatory protein QseB n=1 Tax=Chitinimonas prasina TaxID=1434937 RepID=A0ABQ5YBP6_9NEIS|nr:response regulator transcription factor [Chitinimonas prasina]GLR12377.1 transcriptional regulatory protein QseB [Chitinimonas prasina]
MRILLVEDDLLLGDGLKAGLGQAGFAVDWVCEGLAAEEALAAEPFSAVVLGWNLPRSDGLSIVRQVRALRMDTPILMLAARDALEDRLIGQESGADGYLVKPVAIAELATRLRALLRRATGCSNPLYQHGKLVLNPATRTVELAGQPLTIAGREFDVLALLLTQPGRPFSREQIESAIYGWGEGLESNAVEAHVHYLRKKLGSDWIKTLRGVGYMLNPAKAKP